jgi:hypothetical protein
LDVLADAGFLCDTAAMLRDQVEETACLNQFMQFITILKQEINVSNGQYIMHPSKYGFSMNIPECSVKGLGQCTATYYGAWDILKYPDTVQAKYKFECNHPIVFILRPLIS